MLDCRVSDVAGSSNAYRGHNEDVKSAQGHPGQTPGPHHTADSDEDEEEVPQARRKKTGDEPSSRQASLQPNFDFGIDAEDEMQQKETLAASEDEQLASQDSGTQSLHEFDGLCCVIAKEPCQS